MLKTPIIAQSQLTARIFTDQPKMKELGHFRYFDISYVCIQTDLLWSGFELILSDKNVTAPTKILPLTINKMSISKNLTKLYR